MRSLLNIYWNDCRNKERKKLHRLGLVQSWDTLLFVSPRLLFGNISTVFGNWDIMYD